MIPNALLASGASSAHRGELATYERWENARAAAPERPTSRPLLRAAWSRVRSLAQRTVAGPARGAHR